MGVQNIMEEFEMLEDTVNKLKPFIGNINDAWKKARFIFYDKSICLKQENSGPCGLFAAIQAYIWKIYEESTEEKSPYAYLIEAILRIMEKIRPNYLFVSDIKDDKKIIIWKSTNDREIAKNYLESVIMSDFTPVKMLYSIAILTGPSWLAQYNDKGEPFVCGRLCYTSMKLVLLILTGDVLDSATDGVSTVSCISEKGPIGLQEFGLVSTDGAPIGKLLSNPISFESSHYVGKTFQIYVVHALGSHFYTVLKYKSQNENWMVRFDQLFEERCGTIIREGDSEFFCLTK